MLTFYLKSRDQVKLVKQLGPDHQSVTTIQKHKTPSWSLDPDWYKRKLWITASGNKKTVMFLLFAVTYLGLLMV
jgi:hypothetical protein